MRADEITMQDIKEVLTIAEDVDNITRRLDRLHIYKSHGENRRKDITQKYDDDIVRIIGELDDIKADIKADIKVLASNILNDSISDNASKEVGNEQDD